MSRVPFLISHLQWRTVKQTSYTSTHCFVTTLKCLSANSNLAGMTVFVLFSSLSPDSPLFRTTGCVFFVLRCDNNGVQGVCVTHPPRNQLSRSRARSNTPNADGLLYRVTRVIFPSLMILCSSWCAGCWFLMYCEAGETDVDIYNYTWKIRGQTSCWHRYFSHTVDPEQDVYVLCHWAKWPKHMGFRPSFLCGAGTSKSTWCFWTWKTCFNLGHEEKSEIGSRIWAT